VTGGTEQTAPAADQQLIASHAVARLEDMLRRFERGAPPPVGARELLRELHNALAEGHPGEGGLTPDQWETARAIAATGLESLEHARPQQLGCETEKALRGVCEIFKRDGVRSDPGIQPARAPTPTRPAEPELSRAYRTAILVVLLATLSVAIFVDRLPAGRIFALLLFLSAGLASIVHGLRLDPEQHPGKPRISDEGRVDQRTVHHRPSRLARDWWVTLGIGIVAIVGYALWLNVPRTSVTPRPAAFVGHAPQGPSRFRISFTVSGSAIRNSVIAWQAQCRSGKEWDDHALSAYAPLSSWTFDGQDYVTANANGITEHVHVIADNGHFTTPTRAAGVFSLSVVLDENGREIDTCKTGTIHWVARAS
jgi:hypothetical protein